MQELLGREAGWEWWAGVGRKNMPGRGISICKGPVAGGTVTLSGHQKEGWWAGARGVSQRCVQTCQETQASQGHVKDFVLYPKNSGMNSPLVSMAPSRLPTYFSLE